MLEYASRRSHVRKSGIARDRVIHPVACDSLASTHPAAGPHLIPAQAHNPKSYPMKILTILQTAALLLIAGASVFAGIPESGQSLIP
jgi:hypothetical protein